MADVRHYPKVGEVFELTLDGGAPENQPLEMVPGGRCNMGWRHRGPTVTGWHTGYFKLIKIGSCHTFDDVRDKLSSYGGIPAGQWREAFKAVYPISSGSPVGVADASWVTPNNNIDFPYVNEDGGLNFLPISGGFGGHWLWLLEEVQKK